MVSKLFTRTTNNRVNYSWPAVFCVAAANWVLSGAMYSEHSTMVQEQTNANNCKMQKSIIIIILHPFNPV